MAQDTARRRKKPALLAGLAGLAVTIIITSEVFLPRYKAIYSEALRHSHQPFDWTRASAEPSSTEIVVFQAETDDTVARFLETKVRVLIWVMTSPKSVEKARAVKATWGRRCKQLLFFSSESNTELPTVALKVSEGREHLTAKTVKAFDYIYKHHYHDAEWFMKADDDTYVILENLRYFLADKNASKPWYSGQHFLPLVKQGFLSGGAGYILSKEALRRFAHRRRYPPLCARDGGVEDVHIGRCMEMLEVRILSSKDSQNRSTFHAFTPEQHALGGIHPVFEKFDPTMRVGPQFISEFAVSFHYVNPSLMYMLDFYLYHLHPFGISRTFTRADRQHPGSQNNTPLP